MKWNRPNFFQKTLAILLTCAFACSLCACDAKSANTNLTPTPTATSVNSPSSEAAATPFPETAPTAAVTPIANKDDLAAVYKAYLLKYQELIAQYGQGKVVDQTYGDGYAAGLGSSYLSGVCVADLMDFNGDGIPDLFVVCYNGGETEKNVHGQEIPTAGSYAMEVWTYENGSLTQLLSVPWVSDYKSYNTDSWSSDCCFVTVFQNADGLPVIQLYEDGAPASYSCVCTNYYEKNGAVQKDQLVAGADDQTFGNFGLNGTPISQDEWNENITGYDTILLCASLSNDSFTNAGIEAAGSGLGGYDYDGTLTQTAQVIAGLENGLTVSFKKAQGDYIPLYLGALDQYNRSRMAQDSIISTPYSYGLYDIDQDGVPELILDTGDCEADRVYQIYTLSGGKLTRTDGIPGSESSLYTNGKAGIIRYEGHMGSYDISETTLNGTTLSTNDIASGYADGAYPELDSFGYTGYSIFGEASGASPAAIYLYSAGGTQTPDKTQSDNKDSNIYTRIDGGAIPEINANQAVTFSFPGQGVSVQYPDGSFVVFAGRPANGAYGFFGLSDMTYGTLEVLKYDSMRSLIWDKTFTAFSDVIYAAAATPDGGALIVTDANYSSVSRLSDGYLTKISADGDILWSDFLLQNAQYIDDIEVAPDGSIYTADSYAGNAADAPAPALGPWGAWSHNTTDGNTAVALNVYDESGNRVASQISNVGYYADPYGNTICSCTTAIQGDDLLANYGDCLVCYDENLMPLWTADFQNIMRSSDDDPSSTYSWYGQNWAVTPGGASVVFWPRQGGGDYRMTQYSAEGKYIADTYSKDWMFPLEDGRTVYINDADESGTRASFSDGGALFAAYNEDITPISVASTPDGGFLMDFGTNNVGAGRPNFDVLTKCDKNGEIEYQLLVRTDDVTRAPYQALPNGLIVLYGQNTRRPPAPSSGPTPAASAASVNAVGNTPDNIQNLGIAAIQGDWIYYANSDGLYKIMTDGREKQKLCGDDGVQFINVIGDWIYYTCFSDPRSDPGQLYKIRTDGGGRQKLCADATSVNVADGWIYYAEDINGDGGLYRMKTDGSEILELLTGSELYGYYLADGWIYYNNVSDNDQLYRVRTDGSDKQKIGDDAAMSLSVVGNVIYYANYNDENTLYTIQTDGGGKKKFGNDEITGINISGGYIYYTDDYASLWRVKTDGTDKRMLCSSRVSNVNIVGNTIFFSYTDIDGHVSLYTMNIDGSERTKFQ